jgi:hypothetical protein
MFAQRSEKDANKYVIYITLGRIYFASVAHLSRPVMSELPQPATGRDG